MCGIVAGASLSISNINNSIDIIRHRGQNQQQTTILPNNSGFIAHARLVINGGETSTQPMNQDGIYIAVNGEFYGWRRIKQDLINEGYIFKTDSDSEILISLYKKYGLKCLEHLEGEFSFVLWDQEKNIWFIARDRFGIKPLYYYQSDNLWLVASESKAFIPWINLELDLNTIMQTQLFQYQRQDQTFFKDVYSIKPGHFAIYNPQKNTFTINQWYSMPNFNSTIHNSDNIGRIIHNTIKDSVIKRIPTDVNYCTYLSGGLDSSIISGLALEESKEITSYILQYTNHDFYDETPKALEVSNFLNHNIGKHHLRVVTSAPTELLNVFEKSIWHAESTAINLHISAKHILNKQIKQDGFDVVLSGEGSDEMFLGYTHFLSDLNISDGSQNYLAGIQLPDSAIDLESILGINNTNCPTWLKAKHSIALKNKTLWGESLLNKTLISNNTINMREELLANKPSSLIDFSRQSWVNYALAQYILRTLDDSTSMAYSLETRVPFLDSLVVDAASHISISQLINYKTNNGKQILRECFNYLLPESILNDKKQSFMAPSIIKLMQDQATYSLVYDKIMSNSKLFDLGIFNKSLLCNFLNDIKSNNLNHVEYDPVMMNILSLSVLTDVFNL